MTTRRKRTQGTASEGVQYVRTVVTRHNCIFQPIPQEDDLGNDAYIEFVQQEDATGCCIAVQVKSGSSYVSHSGGRFSFSADRDHFEYWSTHTLPVCAIIFDPVSERAVWLDISAYLEANPHVIQFGPYTISIPATAVFSSETFPAFRKHFLSYRGRYTRHANFGRALENFSRLDDTEACMDGMRALFSFHRNRPASWYYVITSLRNFRGHPLLPHIIGMLSYVPGHGDIFWHADNIIPESTRQTALATLRTRLGRDDVVAMLEAVDDYGFSRGSIGFCVDVLVHQAGLREPILESIAFDASLEDRTRVFALHLLSYYVERRSPEECIALIERFLVQYPDTDWGDVLDGQLESLRNGDSIP